MYGKGAYIMSKSKINGKNSIKIALCGNPNVGKSTVFNELTGLNQHTGNWPGKTVSSAMGNYSFSGYDFSVTDLPGTYSLCPNSAEEEVTRDYILSDDYDVIAAVADSTCLERNLNFVFQLMRVNKPMVLCLNLMDEAEKKGIELDVRGIEDMLKIPVVAVTARSGKGISDLQSAVLNCVLSDNEISERLRPVYPPETCEMLGKIGDVVFGDGGDDNCGENSGGFIIDNDENDAENHAENYGENEDNNAEIISDGSIDTHAENHSVKYPMHEDSVRAQGLCELVLQAAKCGETVEHLLEGTGRGERCAAVMNLLCSDEDITQKAAHGLNVGIIKEAENVFRRCVLCCNGEKNGYSSFDRKIDRILTSKRFGIPIMLLCVVFIFWLTAQGANYPSAWLSDLFAFIEKWLCRGLYAINAPQMVISCLVGGIYKTVSWVVSVMLPPMAIFFPLFTLLEDSGILPRMAFNMDKFMRSCGAHGKQTLTMCMGIGCNACGITGCRIIESRRERLIAILTNNFIPCNGRFPTIIAMLTVFVAAPFASAFKPLVTAVGLTLILVICVFITWCVSKILSKTLLKGEVSAFSLELPSYRRPQIAKVLVRSLLDRTLFVLGRAVMVAAPAGLIIWILGNVHLSGGSMLDSLAGFFSPFGALLGLDGMIIVGFLLGFPANEIVIPIILMGYLSAATLTDYDGLDGLYKLLCANGWTLNTAISMITLTVFHYPCATSVLTLYHETKSVKWTALSVIIPTAVGILLCMAETLVFNCI